MLYYLNTDGNSCLLGRKRTFRTTETLIIKSLKSVFGLKMRSVFSKVDAAHSKGFVSTLTWQAIFLLLRYGCRLALSFTRLHFITKLSITMIKTSSSNLVSKSCTMNSRDWQGTTDVKRPEHSKLRGRGICSGMLSLSMRGQSERSSRWHGLPVLMYDSSLIHTEISCCSFPPSISERKTPIY
jgi:hypothetical protein